MTTTEFTLWLNGYLEALETEGIEKILIKNIRTKLNEVKGDRNQERVVFGPNVKQPKQQGYINPDNGRPIV
tara:strand:+ start:357 stop:569 length:213 start_codon:yes stop_codon:yes gene_type:complete